MHSFKVLIYFCSLFDFGPKGVVPWGATHEYTVQHCKFLTLTLHFACACTLGGGLNERERQNRGGGECWKGMLEGVLEGVPTLERFARRVR